MSFLPSDWLKHFSRGPFDTLGCHYQPLQSYYGGDSGDYAATAVSKIFQRALKIRIWPFTYIWAFFIFFLENHKLLEKMAFAKLVDHNISLRVPLIPLDDKCHFIHIMASLSSFIENYSLYEKITICNSFCSKHFIKDPSCNLGW